jgi:hypothetical protein
MWGRPVVYMTISLDLFQAIEKRNHREAIGMYEAELSRHQLATQYDPRVIDYLDTQCTLFTPNMPRTTTSLSRLITPPLLIEVISRGTIMGSNLHYTTCACAQGMVRDSLSAFFFVFVVTFIYYANNKLEGLAGLFTGSYTEI